MAAFDYTKIPLGFYQDIIENGPALRRAWHLQKFERVVESIAETQTSVLDIGCFAGTFLSRLPNPPFLRQVGVDILPDQVDYAQKRFGTSFRKFFSVKTIADLDALPEIKNTTFDVVTLIEVIEHLTVDQIRDIFGQCMKLVKPGGQLIITTPNYFSHWPVVEWLVNRLSHVKYEEQHITKFSYPRVLRQLELIDSKLFSFFDVEFVTTTHLLAPFLAGLSFEGAMRMSRAVPHRHWKVPFGCLILLSLRRR